MFAFNTYLFMGSWFPILLPADKCRIRHCRQFLEGHLVTYMIHWPWKMAWVSRGFPCWLFFISFRQLIAHLVNPEKIQTVDNPSNQSSVHLKKYKEMVHWLFVVQVRKQWILVVLCSDIPILFQLQNYETWLHLPTILTVTCLEGRGL